jgi:hypothetical protein
MLENSRPPGGQIPAHLQISQGQALKVDPVHIRAQTWEQRSAILKAEELGVALRLPMHQMLEG